MRPFGSVCRLATVCVIPFASVYDRLHLFATICVSMRRFATVCICACRFTSTCVGFRLVATVCLASRPFAPSCDRLRHVGLRRVASPYVGLRRFSLLCITFRRCVCRCATVCVALRLSKSVSLRRFPSLCDRLAGFITVVDGSTARVDEIESRLVSARLVVRWFGPSRVISALLLSALVAVHGRKDLLVSQVGACSHCLSLNCPGSSRLGSSA